MDKVNILGTEYTICERTIEEDIVLEKCDAYCDKTTKEIVICKCDDSCTLHNPEWYSKKLVRHEIIRAFLFESGMGECSYWGKKDECEEHSEQFVDWFAIQSPKIFKVFSELGIL